MNRCMGRQTDRRTEADCTAQSGHTEADAGSRFPCGARRRRATGLPSPPRLGSQRSLARTAGPLTSRSVAEAVPQIAGQERSGRRASQQTDGPASALTFLWEAGVQALPALPAPGSSRQAQLDLWALRFARAPHHPPAHRFIAAALEAAPLAPPRPGP